MEKPSKATLAFLVTVTRRLAALRGGGVQGDFYADLLRALAVEGEHQAALALLDLRPRVRARVEEKEKVAAAVELITRLAEELTRLGRLKESSESSTNVS
jgi:hypothetical protein